MVSWSNTWSLAKVLASHRKARNLHTPFPNESPFHMEVWWYPPCQLSPVDVHTLQGAFHYFKGHSQRKTDVTFNTGVCWGMFANTSYTFQVTVSVYLDVFKERPWNCGHLCEGFIIPEEELQCPFIQNYIWQHCHTKQHAPDDIHSKASFLKVVYDKPNNVSTTCGIPQPPPPPGFGKCQQSQ